MSVEIGAQAREIIARLKAIDRANPRIDRAAVEAALARHFDQLGMKPLPVRWMDDAEEGISAARSAARSAAMSAAMSAARSAAWSAARSAAESAAIDRWIGIWLPFVDASEAGLWLFWVLEAEVLAVPRPALRIADDRLHCSDGPAVSWPNGTRYWFWRGVQVTQDVIEAPEALTVKRIDEEKNVEVRRVMLDRFGVTRWLQEGGAEEIHRDETGILYRKVRPGDSDVLMVRVECPSTGHVFFLRVHPQLRPLLWKNPDGSARLGRKQKLTARNAVASTFGKLGSQYRPAVQS